MGARLEGSMGRLSGIRADIIANLAERERETLDRVGLIHISVTPRIFIRMQIIQFRFRIRSLWTHDQSEQFLFQFHWCQNVSDFSRI